MRFSHVAAAAICASGLFAAAQAQASVAISADPTQNMSCLANVCTPTAADAVLNAGDLAAMLASGNTVVATTGTGVEAGDLRVTAPFSWTAATLLTLVVHRATVFAGAVNVEGNGGVAIMTGTRQGVAALSFTPGSSLSFSGLSSVLVINDTRYKLEKSIKSLARDVVAHPNRAFALTGDLDAHRESVYPSSPVAIAFSGKFTGLGHTISGLRIADMASASVGLFATVLAHGAVANIGIEKSVVAGAQTVGGLVGFNGGTVSNAFTAGTVRAVGTGSSGQIFAAGGLVGHNSGRVLNCRSEARVLGASATGGLVGMNDGGTIQRSFATGSITGLDEIGGLAGSNSGQDIRVSGSIVDSYAMGKVKSKGSAQTAAGGLVGYNPGVGDAFSTIATSYSTGEVGPPQPIAGGFIGAERGVATNSYWDTTASGTSQAVGDGDATGITGLTTAQFLSGLPAGFDPAVWSRSPSVNAGYPYLLDNPPQ